MLTLHKKQLNKVYKKRFKTLNKSFFKSYTQGIIIFEEYLKYLRDLTILNTATDSENESVKTRIATINTAVAEFASWQKTDDESKKEFHWNNFCELLKLNMKEWLELDDSI